MDTFAVDTKIEANWVEFSRDGATLRAYLAKPAGRSGLPAIIMAHENLGVTAHRQDVTRRLAREGFVTLSVDLYSRIGGQPPQDYKTPDERRAKAFLAAADEQSVPDLEAGRRYLGALPEVDSSRIGTIGFCLGGGPSLVWATQSSELKACVVLYGLPVLPSEYTPDGKPRSRVDIAGSVKCPVQAHFGASDEVIPLEQVHRLEAALAGSKQDTEVIVHPGAGHAYHDDTHPHFHPQAAQQTWDSALAFFRRYL